MRPDVRLWAVWLFGLLLIPVVAGIVGWRPNEVPGTPAEGPGWQASRLLDDQYYRALDDWIGDRSATRGAGLWFRRELDYVLLGDSPSPLVAVGDDGWLFSRSFVDVPCAHIDAIARPAVGPVADGAFTYLVPLAKVHWLSDLLEPHDRPDACTVTARDRLRSRLTSDPDWFDVNDALDDDPRGSFYPRDPHWGPQGRVRVAEAIVERFSPGLWDPAAVVAEPETTLQGMDRFLGVGRAETRAGTAVNRDVELSVDEQRFGLGLLIWQRSTVANGAVIPGTTFIIGDSQMAGVIPYLDQYFEELVFIGWLQTQLAPLPLDDLPAPDRLIVEAVDQWAAESFTSPAVAAIGERLPAAGG